MRGKYVSLFDWTISFFNFFKCPAFERTKDAVKVQSSTMYASILTLVRAYIKYNSKLVDNVFPSRGHYSACTQLFSSIYMYRLPLQPGLYSVFRIKAPNGELTKNLTRHFHILLATPFVCSYHHNQGKMNYNWYE